MRYHKVPDETIRRLSRYLRVLVSLLREGTREISSRRLADLLAVNPWQIRKDFSFFGGLGTRGVGYDVEKLIKKIGKILKLDIARKAALIGVGNLGMALLAYPGFGIYGLEIAAAFDTSPKKIGQRINKITVEDAASLGVLKERKIDIAIIAVPKEAAQDIADRLVQAGVVGILNFAPCYLTVPKKVKVITIDIAMDLARLPYYMPAS